MHRLFILLLWFSSLHSIAQSNSDSLSRFIRQKGDSLLQAQQLPGMLVGISTGGKHRFFSFGYALPDEKVAFDSATLYEAGSITKTFTAFIVETVLDEKKITDTASIFPYLPDSVRVNSGLASITFRSLLNHTSGLPRLPANLDLSGKAPYDNYHLSQLFSYLKTVQLEGSGQYNYSNLGAGLAGVLAQQLSGKSYTALLEAHVFKPFGIRRTKNPRKSQGYFDGEKVAFWNMAALAPAGDLDCTASELLDYLDYLSQPTGTPQAQRIARMETPTKTINPQLSIGLGWHLLQQKEKPVIYWHNGGTYGFSTFAAYRKATRQAVVVVINRFNKNAVSDALGIAVVKKMLD